MGKNQKPIRLLEKYFDHQYDVRPNYPLLRHYIELACKGKDWDGCADLGALYEQGIAVEKDLTKAKTLYDQACRHQSEIGCKALEQLEQQGGEKPPPP